MEKDLYVVQLSQIKRRREEVMKRIRVARMKSFRAVLPLDCDRRCWIESCTFQRILSSKYFMCPAHSALHCCDEQTCKPDIDGKCLFTSHVLQEEEEYVQFVPETQLPSGRLDNRGELLNAQFNKGMCTVISSLCDPSKRVNAGMSAPPSSTFEEQKLLERDVTAISRILFMNCTNKKELKTLQTHGQEVTYYILDKALKGVTTAQNVVLFKIPYASWLLPLPTRIKFKCHFGVSLDKYASCLKIAQGLLTLQSVQNRLQELTRNTN